eukprot:10999508-Heterocapsa_arctica.AAC.1
MSVASCQQGHELGWGPSDELGEVAQSPSLQKTVDGGRIQNLTHDEVAGPCRNIMTDFTGNAP